MSPTSFGLVKHVHLKKCVSNALYGATFWGIEQPLADVETSERLGPSISLPRPISATRLMDFLFIF